MWDKIVEFLTARETIVVCIRIVLAIVVIIAGCKIARVISRKIVSSKGMQKINKTTQSFLSHVIRIILYIAVVLIGMIILGINLSIFSAIIASAGLAIGLALQGGLSNIAGGVMLVGFKPFEVNDFIESEGVSGTVTDIGIFYTTLLTPDNKKVVLPNGGLSNSIITNYSATGTRRLDLDFSIAYSADIDVAKKVLLACAKAEEKVLEDPAPEVHITAHRDSSIQIRLRIWVKTGDYWATNFALLENVKRSFDKFGVQIPFPQVDVHFDK